MKKLGMKKVWVPVIALCSVGLIVGTGYAAWTITKNGAGEGTGSFIADTVEEENIEVKNLKWYDDEAGTAESNGDICFGWDTNYAVKETDWLTNKTKGKEAKMVQVLKFDVVCKNCTANVTVSNLELAKDTVDEKKTAYNTATTGDQQRIVPPTTLVATPDTASANTKEDGTTTTPYSIKIEFDWGDKFGKQNPIRYYNGLTSVTDEIRSNAKSDLGTLAKLDGIQFKLTITAKAAKSGTASK